MRLAGFLVVPLMTAGIAATGLYVAAPAVADCEARGGSMLCTDEPDSDAAADSSSSGSGSGSGSATSYPCVIDLYCNNFEFDVVIDEGDGGPDTDTPGRRFPRPKPTPNN